MKIQRYIVIALLLFCLPCFAEDQLPSWNEGKTKQSIVDFVERVTSESSDDYIIPSKRIAVFDNDGNLWAEKPVYFQLLYAIDQIKTLADENPQWKTEEPFKAIIENDRATISKFGEKEILQLVLGTHAGMTTEKFATSVKQWLKTAKHPTTNRPYTKMVYQPMLELLTYLRANGFKTFIVSGGGIDFVRTFSEEVYGIPPEQVVGSSIKTKFELRDGKPVIVRLPELNFIDDKAGKPVGIWHHIGMQPVFASGNSDGDLQMIQWTTAGKGARFGLIVHHTDAEREWAYDRESHVGRLDKAMEEAKAKGWTLIDMKKDWNTIYPE